MGFAPTENLLPLSVFRHGGAGEPGLLLGYAALGPERIDVGIRQLAEALRAE